jgi:hypothetical protein
MADEQLEIRNALVVISESLSINQTGTAAHCAPSYTYDMHQHIESKEKMRARGVRSPDEWARSRSGSLSPCRPSRKRVGAFARAAGGRVPERKSRSGNTNFYGT